MFERLKALLGERREEPSRRPVDELQLAAAALLTEAAMLDGEFAESERRTIRRLLTRRFGLDEAGVDALMAEAEGIVAHSAQLFPFTRVLKDRLDAEERIKLIELLWEVAYADGEVHDYEATLLRRVGGLLYVTDRDRGAARKRVLSRLGLKDSRILP